MTPSESIHFFQVGSHIGNTQNDHIYSTNVQDKHMILIEPVPFLFEQLKQNYLDKSLMNDIEFLNIAVSNVDSEITLYVPSVKNDFSRFPSWASQLASCIEGHIQNHCLGMKVDKIAVPCFRLNTLIQQRNITHIEYLLVDTEGHDYDILMDLDFNLCKPIHIIFENKHMDGICQRGKKYNDLIKRFIEYGYKIISEDGEDTHITLDSSIL